MGLATLARRAGALAVLASAIAASAAPSRAEDVPERYPDAPHREETFYYCTPCHGFGLVAQQGLSRARWDETLDWMHERHNMPEPSSDERDRILDYLEDAFPPRDRPGPKNPFLP